MANKVKYNLKNVHYAKATIAADGSATFGTIKPWPGAVSLTLDAENSEAEFYADGIKYFSAYGNNGYAGEFESALVPADFRTSILNEIDRTADGVMLETTDGVTSPFALLFEFDGDVNEIKHVMYNCVASRPSIGSQTIEDSIEVQTETINITASSIYNAVVGKNLVKARCEESDKAAFSNWYTTVYQPTASPTPEPEQE